MILSYGMTVSCREGESMPRPSDELAARRWLRELFRKLGAKHPGLKTTEAQERLTAELERQRQEDKNHGETR
jgi:hypothetical protein